LPLLNDAVTDVRVEEGGHLSLTVGTVEVHVPAHPDYEAWSVNGPNGVLLFSTPGGSLALWDA
jgi:hypothetical protein